MPNLELWNEYRWMMRTTPPFVTFERYAKLPLLHFLARSFDYPPCILEIGVQHGWGMLPLATAAAEQGGHYTGVDVTITEDARALLRRFGLEKRAILLQMPSKKFWESAEGAYCLVVVDGGHDYDTARMDIINALRHLLGDGWLLVHDTQLLEGPKRAFHEICTIDNGILGLDAPSGDEGMGMAFVADPERLGRFMKHG